MGQRRVITARHGSRDRSDPGFGDLRPRGRGSRWRIRPAHGGQGPSCGPSVQHPDHVAPQGRSGAAVAAPPPQHRVAARLARDRGSACAAARVDPRGAAQCVARAQPRGAPPRGGLRDRPAHGDRASCGLHHPRSHLPGAYPAHSSRRQAKQHPGLGRRRGEARGLWHRAGQFHRQGVRDRLGGARRPRLPRARAPRRSRRPPFRRRLCTRAGLHRAAHGPADGTVAEPGETRGVRLSHSDANPPDRGVAATGERTHRDRRANGGVPG